MNVAGGIKCNCNFNIDVIRDFNCNIDVILAVTKVGWLFDPPLHTNSP